MVGAVGCGVAPGPPRDLDAIPLVGQNVTLFYDPGQEPCAGTLPYLDATVAALGQYLNLPIKAPIPYYFTQDLSACQSASDLGCAIPYKGVVSCWSSQPALTHELVHAVQIDQTGDDTPSLLLEGQAVSLGQLQYLDTPTDQSATDAALLSTNQIGRVDYPLAGDFVSYLLGRFGPGPFEQTIAAIGNLTTVDEIEAAFARSYGGETMADLRADRAASPETFYGNRLSFSECMAATPDPRLGQPGTVDEAVDCGSNAYGVPTGQVTRDVPFDVTAEGLYTLQTTSPASGLVTLASCDGQRALRIYDDIQPGSIIIGYLHPGRYVFVLQAAGPASPSTFTLGVEPLALGPSPPCASVAPVPVPAGTQHIYLLSMDDRTFEVPFVLAAPATLSANGLGNSSSAELCAGGCGTGCQASRFDAQLPPVSAGVTFSLRAMLVGQPDLIGEDLR
jgi:hypothetical protein